MSAFLLLLPFTLVLFGHIGRTRLSGIDDIGRPWWGGRGDPFRDLRIVAPGGGFYVNPLNGKNQVRVAYVLNCKDLKKAIMILGKSLEVYKTQFG